MTSLSNRVKVRVPCMIAQVAAIARVPPRCFSTSTIRPHLKKLNLIQRCSLCHRCARRQPQNVASNQQISVQNQQESQSFEAGQVDRDRVSDISTISMSSDPNLVSYLMNIFVKPFVQIPFLCVVIVEHCVVHQEGSEL